MTSEAVAARRVQALAGDPGLASCSVTPRAAATAGRGSTLGLGVLRHGEGGLPGDLAGGAPQDGGGLQRRRRLVRRQVRQLLPQAPAVR
ncbi:hypothetical protein [Actinacidiphila bryophytorum]|uniref:hypothetical protein n=1 Tax=Actinacidiphila bryophytorum TaxID=1436133 RepID=UPI0019600429|nr:hypothetical protein [Actinacidiphila bryophytorum]MBM9440600.1 hypothetical protein [Actinacidiphila bryophytorum]MBN6543183.1 hypothetical protein [Actinacidiphila bryophytorum]